MIEINEITSEDIQRLRPIFQCGADMFKGIVGIYYKVNIDGKEKVLHRVDNYFVLYELKDDNNVVVEMFTVDENYQLEEVGLPGYDVHYANILPIIQQKGTNVLDILIQKKYPTGCDYKGYTGQIVYMQRNVKNGLVLTFHYPRNVFNEDNNIYPYHIKKPYLIRLERQINLFGKDITIPLCGFTLLEKEFDYENNPLEFNIAVAKEYGTGAILGKDPVSVHGSSEITRYYECLHITKSHHAITLFPFNRQYKLEDVYELIEEKGFKRDIPQILFDYHNGEIPVIKTYQELATIMNDIEVNKGNEKGVRLVFSINGKVLDNGTDS